MNRRGEKSITEWVIIRVAAVQNDRDRGVLVRWDQLVIRRRRSVQHQEAQQVVAVENELIAGEATDQFRIAIKPNSAIRDNDLPVDGIIPTENQVAAREPQLQPRWICRGTDPAPTGHTSINRNNHRTD